MRACRTRDIPRAGRLHLEALPIDPAGSIPRDLPKFISTHRAEHFYRGAWGWFALTVLVALLAPLVEELFFRGLLLPRMRAAFGKGDWVAHTLASFVIIGLVLSLVLK